MRLAERLERRELDHRHHLSLEQRRQHEDVVRRRFAEARADADVVLGRLGEQDRRLLERGLADEPLAELEAVRDGLALLVRVARDEPQLDARRSSPSAMKNAPWCAPTSGVSSDMIIRLTVSRSRWPCIIPVKRARFELSQSCSAFRRVVSARLRIISLMLSFSSATSPFASTAIERVRSPCVTAVETSAIART